MIKFMFLWWRDILTTLLASKETCPILFVGMFLHYWLNCFVIHTLPWQICNSHALSYHFPDVNECDSNPCVNGGTCRQRDHQDIYWCQCPPGYTGDNCEIGLCGCAACLIIWQVYALYNIWYTNLTSYGNHISTTLSMYMHMPLFGTSVLTSKRNES